MIQFDPEQGNWMVQRFLLSLFLPLLRLLL